MKFYYGLIDAATHCWGFVDETDQRANPETMIELTEEEWEQLFDEQSQGREIVYYEGRVFTTNEHGRYYCDEEGWHKLGDEEYQSKIDAENKEQKKAEYLARLNEIDAESARPLRAINAGTATEFDRQKLANLESEAAEIRIKLAELG